MIKIVGGWEIDWNTSPEIEVWHWNLTLRDYDIKDWYMWPNRNVINKERDVNLMERDNLKQVLLENKDLTFVFVEPQNPDNPMAFHDAVSLEDFEHPKDVLYIFGNAHYTTTKEKKEGDLSVTIPTIHNKGVPWPHACLMVILYDRLIKRGKEKWQ
jgi:hypothetical protein